MKKARIKPVKINNIISFLSNISAFLLGFSFIISVDDGLNPRVIAGKLSVTKFINNICKASKTGTCHPRNGASKTPINKIFETAPISLMGWIYAIIPALLLIAVFDLLKAINNKKKFFDLEYV